MGVDQRDLAGNLHVLNILRFCNQEAAPKVTSTAQGSGSWSRLMGLARARDPGPTRRLVLCIAAPHFRYGSADLIAISWGQGGSYAIPEGTCAYLVAALCAATLHEKWHLGMVVSSLGPIT